MDSKKRSLCQTLLAAPLLSLLPAIANAQNPVPIAVSKLHSFGIRVADVDRSIEFYQGLFGAAVLARYDDSAVLRVGEGPQYFTISPTRNDEQSAISHIGLAVDGFEIDSVKAQLLEWGLSEHVAEREPELPRLELALHFWERIRVAWADNKGTIRELYFWDAEGVAYQLQSADFCGDLGNCEGAEPGVIQGLFKLINLSHFTTFLANKTRANSFYTRLFGKTYQAYQGENSPIIGIGDGLQFLMYVGGENEGKPSAPGRIDHACFTMEDFDVEDIRSKLTAHGLEARVSSDNTQPLMHWVSLRMPNRGGVEGGTPEVYFSDPDGIRIQLQSFDYCGGGGYLGNSCREV